MRPAPPGPRTFFFIRHGETDWNREGRLQGQRDIALNALGRRQAAQTGAILAAILADRDLAAADRCFVASPLARTRCTMALLRRGLDLPSEPYRLDDRLKELSFGRWEGLTWPEIRHADAAGFEARRRDKWGFVPPEGESYGLLVDRLTHFLGDLEEASVVVAHGGVARVLMHLVTGLDRRRAPTEDILQGRVLLFERGTARWI